MGIKRRLDISKDIKLSSLRLSALGKIKHVALSTVNNPCLSSSSAVYSLHFFFTWIKSTQLNNWRPSANVRFIVYLFVSLAIPAGLMWTDCNCKGNGMFPNVSPPNVRSSVLHILVNIHALKITCTVHLTNCKWTLFYTAWVTSNILLNYYSNLSEHLTQHMHLNNQCAIVAITASTAFLF